MVNLQLFIQRNPGVVLLPENDQWTNRVQIKSESSSRLYIIAQNKANKTWGCSCMGWKAHRKCKHLNTFLPAIGVGQ